MPDLPTFLTASCLISLAWLSNRETSEILPPIKPILTICPLTVAATIRMTRNCLAKPLRKPIAQWPIMGPWRNLRHRFNNQSGAGLRAGGGPVECDGIICAAGAPNLGCHPKSNDHHTAQRARDKYGASTQRSRAQFRLRKSRNSAIFSHTSQPQRWANHQHQGFGTLASSKSWNGCNLGLFIRGRPGLAVAQIDRYDTACLPKRHSRSGRCRGFRAASRRQFCAI